MRAHVVFALVASVFFLVAGAFGYAAAAWRIESEYAVGIDAAPSLSWTLWLPRPTLPMTLSVTGNAGVASPVPTIHGTLENVTGTGAATVTYRYRAIILAGPDPWRLGGRPNPTGQEGTDGFWVWRQSSDPSSWVDVTGGAFWIASGWADRYTSGGPGFEGNASDGWTLVPARFGGGTHLIGEPSAESISSSFLIAGITMAVVAVGIRMRLRASA